MTANENLDLIGRGGLWFSEIFKAMKPTPREFITYASVASMIEAYFDIEEMVLKLKDGEIACKIKGDRTQVYPRALEAQPQHADSANAAPDVSGDAVSSSPIANGVKTLADMIVRRNEELDEKDAKIEALEATIEHLTAALSEQKAADMARDYIDAETEHYAPYFEKQMTDEIATLTAANRALESKIAACLAIEVWVVEAGDIGYYEGEIVGWNEARDEFRAILLSDAAQAESDESEGA